jgi:hypothetical protein
MSELRHIMGQEKIRRDAVIKFAFVKALTDQVGRQIKHFVKNDAEFQEFMKLAQEKADFIIQNDFLVSATDYQGRALICSMAKNDEQINSFYEMAEKVLEVLEKGKTAGH